MWAPLIFMHCTAPNSSQVSPCLASITAQTGAVRGPFCPPLAKRNDPKKFFPVYAFFGLASTAGQRAPSQYLAGAGARHRLAAAAQAARGCVFFARRAGSGRPGAAAVLRSLTALCCEHIAAPSCPWRWPCWPVWRGACRAVYPRRYWSAVACVCCVLSGAAGLLWPVAFGGGELRRRGYSRRAPFGWHWRRLWCRR